MTRDREVDRSIRGALTAAGIPEPARSGLVAALSRDVARMVRRVAEQLRGSGTDGGRAVSRRADRPPSTGSIPRVFHKCELFLNDRKLMASMPARYHQWRQAWPYLDVDAEIVQAHLWVLDHPEDPIHDLPTFLETWLKKPGEEAEAKEAPRPTERTDAERLAEIRKTWPNYVDP